MALAAAARQGSPRGTGKTMRPPAETGSRGRGGAVRAGGRRQGRQAEVGQCRQTGSEAAKIFGASIRGVRGRINMRGFHLGSGKPPEKARLKKSKHFLVFLEMRDFLSTAPSPRWRAAQQGGIRQRRPNAQPTRRAFYRGASGEGGGRGKMAHGGAGGGWGRALFCRRERSERRQYARPQPLPEPRCAVR